MIYKNILRTIKTKPLQFLALVLIMMMSSFTYVSLQNSVTALKTYLNEYTNTTQQEDFFLVFTPPSQSELITLLSEENYDGMNVVDYYEYQSDVLEQNYDVTMEGRFHKDLIEEKDVTHTYRFIKPTNTVNQTYLLEGALPFRDNEIAIFKQYADANDLSLHDTLTINDTTYEITGFVAIPDYIYPIFSYDSLLYEAEYETIVVATNEVYESLDAKPWVLYSGVFNDGIYDENKLEAMSEEGYAAYALGRDLNVRISTIYNDIQGNELLATTFSSFILVMAIFIMIVVLRKRIDSDRVQIGILKAMGYQTFNISLNYCLYPLLASLIGSSVGYLLGQYCSSHLANRYVTHYIIPNIIVDFDVNILLGGVIYPSLIVTAASFIILSYLLSKKPLQLMQKASHLKVSMFSKLVGRLLAPFSFETRFRYSLVLRNSGKVVGLFLTVLFGSMFLVFATMAFSAVDMVVSQAFGHANYEYQVQFKTDSDEPLTFGTSPFFEVSAELEKVVTTNGEVVTYPYTMPFMVHGVLADDFVNPLVNRAGDIISVKEGLVINEFISSAYQINIGDEVTLQISGQNKTFSVVEIADHYNGPFMYVNLYELNDLMRVDKGSYNGVWTSTRPQDESNVSYIFSIEDLMRNLEIAMEMVKISLVIMICMAALLALIIMMLIANVIIEENYEQILVLKVLGYHDKEVSRLILTIYFPFVILAYLLSIPITQSGVNLVMAAIAKELPMSIPVQLSLVQVVVGLIIIFVTYSISLVFSRQSLHKVSLQELLKH